MKHLLFAAAMIATASSTAFAGSPIMTIALEPVLEVPESNWAGPYAGLLASFDGGTVANNSPVTALFRLEDLSGGMYGAFAGYNFQSGALVYGAEFAYLTGTAELSAVPVAYFSNFFDAKLRVGADLGAAMIYGFGGYSSSSFTFGVIDYSPTGTNYGAGIDVMVTKDIFAGVEYIVRDLSDGIIAATVESVQLRVGMQF